VGSTDKNLHIINKHNNYTARCRHESVIPYFLQPVYYSSALATLELLMIRRGILLVPNISANDINALLCVVCTNYSI